MGAVPGQQRVDLYSDHDAISDQILKDSLGNNADLFVVESIRKVR